MHRHVLPSETLCKIIQLLSMNKNQKQTPPAFPYRRSRSQCALHPTVPTGSGTRTQIERAREPGLLFKNRRPRSYWVPDLTVSEWDGFYVEMGNGEWGFLGVKIERMRFNILTEWTDVRDPRQWAGEWRRVARVARWWKKEAGPPFPAITPGDPVLCLFENLRSQIGNSQACACNWYIGAPR